jgi:hypothetical protein
VSARRLPPELPVALARRRLVLDRAGALWWPARRVLVFADLHLGKGEAIARRGSFLPPYDTVDTLSRLAAEVERRAPAHVLCLGDSLHEPGSAARLDRDCRDLLAALMHGRRWTWVHGNHDADAAAALGGEAAAELAVDGLVFRHAAEGAAPAGEISGHFHPKARLRAYGRSVARPCFAEDGRRLILPAFGAFAGGLDVGDPAFAAIFPRGFTAHLTGKTGLFSLPCRRGDLSAAARRV